MVFQEYGRSLFPWMSVRDNVELPLKQKKLPKARRRELVDGALAGVGLEDTHRAYPWQLSGGMQQRFAIARAVACEPSVLLMDEDARFASLRTHVYEQIQAAKLETVSFDV